MGGAGTAARRTTIQGAARADSLRGLLLTQPCNVRYLTGFTGSGGWLLLRDEQAVLITDPRYGVQAASQAIGCTVAISERGLVAGLAEHGGLAAGDAVGYEAHVLTCAVLDELQETLPRCSWVPQPRRVESLRQIKEPVEIDAIRRALRIAEISLSEVASELCAGMTEVEVAAALDYACRRRGAERMAFDTIVAAGPNAALPHAQPGPRVLRSGDVVLVDMGCVVEGYCSDITRCLVLGTELPAPWAAWHEAVAAAQAAALGAIRDGVAGSSIDAVAREALDERGLGDRFVHGLGHGVGLEIHEGPCLSSRSEECLASGQVVTVEPGVYLSGHGGIRLEDLVVVTDAGCERLNELPPDPIWCPPTC